MSKLKKKTRWKLTDDFHLQVLQNEGRECYKACDMKQGPCKWCGSGGMCCSQNQERNDTSVGCDGRFVGQTRPKCVLDPLGEFFCYSWKMYLVTNNDKIKYTT